MSCILSLIYKQCVAYSSNMPTYYELHVMYHTSNMYMYNYKVIICTIVQTYNRNFTLPGNKSQISKRRPMLYPHVSYNDLSEYSVGQHLNCKVYIHVHLTYDDRKLKWAYHLWFIPKTLVENLSDIYKTCKWPVWLRYNM